MGTKKPAKNVKNLIAAAEANKAVKAAAPRRAAKEMRLRGKKHKTAPTHVLTLIAKAVNRQKGKS
jgi:hypothetical protein